MIVIGLMSGTSCDGIDVALVEITGRGPRMKARLKNFWSLPYSKAVRRQLLRMANANLRPILSVAEISQTNFLLGELFAKAVTKACRRFRVPLKRIDLIGSHGHTVYHQPQPELFAGQRIGSTLQIGEAAIIAERSGVAVVSNFRPRDLAAGGEGAPLVPFVDYLLYRHARFGRVALNLGGIANVTVIPAGAQPEEVIALDTGPGNMVMDALMEHGSKGRRRFDRNGRLAAQGKILEPVLQELLRHRYFRRRPPKSTGREEFGQEFTGAFLRRTRRASLPDRVRTATELTVQSIARAFERFIVPVTPVREIILGGGGAQNHFLVKRLQESLPDLTFRPADDFGVSSDAKEAFAFAVLAYQTWHNETATLPSATGARHATVLGSITPGKS
jgi:anhydro-N-acetylmuramic acid kinase